MLGPGDALFARRGFALDKQLAKLGHPDAPSDAAGVDAAGGGGGGGGGAAAAAVEEQQQQQQQQQQPGAGRRAAAPGPGGPPPDAPLRAAVVRWEGGGDIEAWLRREWWA
jgi:hypothetical protein